MDPSKDVIKLNIDITTAEGTVIKLIKFLARFDTSLTADIPFDLAPRTNGWRLYDFWPSTVLTPIQVKITRAVKIKSLNSASRENTRELSEVWKTPAGDSNGDVEWHTIPRTFGGKSMENEDFVEFIMKVSCDETSWHIARRYTEFDALRQFLLTQNPHNTDFQQANSRFPGKALVFRKSVLDARLRGLESFVSFYLENARYCRQNALDALCSFLQIPEHLFYLSKDSVPTSTAGIRTILPPQNTTPAAATSVSNAVTNSQAVTLSKPTSGPVVKAGAVASSASDHKGITTTVAIKPSVSPDTLPIQQHASTPLSTSETPAFAALMGTSDDEDLTLSAAQRRLLEILGDGMHIIKHGRQGAPKSRLLRCNRQATELFIQADDHRKTLKLVEVESIRLGTDVDPITTAEALRGLQDNVSEASAKGKRMTLSRRASYTLRGKPDNSVYFGTATLRRTCKAEDMRFCLSLIMADRTFDIQCRSLEDLNALHTILVEICKK